MSWPGRIRQKPPVFLTGGDLAAGRQKSLLLGMGELRELKPGKTRYPQHFAFHLGPPAGKMFCHMGLCNRPGPP